MANVPNAGELALEFELPDSTQVPRRLTELISHSRLVLPVFGLFHRAGGAFTNGITIGKVGDASPLRVQCLPHRIVTDEEGFPRYVPASPGAAIPPEGVEMA